MDMNTQHSEIDGLQIVPLPAFQDNYIWLLRMGNTAAVVDPGDAAVVEAYLHEHGLDLVAILVTHHHPDHTGGLRALTAARSIPVYGPAGQSIDHVSEAVSEGDMVVLPDLDLRFEVLEVPGHTRTHIAFHSPGVLFPGDTLFSAGCGRLLGGTAAQLHASLQRLAALPDETAVYCTHEYTLANLAFSSEADPDNSERDRWNETCRALRASGKPTLPSTIDREKRINPFLRTSAPGVIRAVTARNGAKPSDSLECFTALRAWKDAF